MLRVGLTGNVEGSLNGRYLTDDGRTFFYSPDGLVSYDTNHLRDIYEFVDGRPQLITTGTANQDSTTTPGGQSRRVVGRLGQARREVAPLPDRAQALMQEDELDAGWYERKMRQNIANLAKALR